MKLILVLTATLMIIAGFVGCSSTSNTNNANLRGTNTNTGYMANNSSMSSPKPMSSPIPMATSNMTSAPNNSKMSIDTKPVVNSKMPASTPTVKMANKPMGK